MSQIPTISVNGVTVLMHFLSLFWFYNKEIKRQHNVNDNAMNTNITSTYSLHLYTAAISQILFCQFKF